MEIALDSTSDTWVALLGVKGGPAIKPGSNMPTASLMRIGGKVILVDADLGVTRGICDQGVALTDLDLIVITHLHSDHYLELGATDAHRLGGGPAATYPDPRPRGSGCLLAGIP